MIYAEALRLQKGWMVSDGVQSGQRTDGQGFFSRPGQGKVLGATEPHDATSSMNERAAAHTTRALPSRSKLLAHSPRQTRIKPLWWTGAIIISIALWYGFYRLLF